MGKPLAQVAAIDGDEAVGLDLGVGGDEEIGNEVLARTAGLPIALEGLSCQVGGLRSDGLVGDGEAGEEFHQTVSVGGGWRKLGKGNRADDERTFRCGLQESLKPQLMAGLAFDDGPQDGGIERGDHDCPGLSSTGPPRRSSMMEAEL